VPEGNSFNAPQRPDPMHLNAARDSDGNTYLHELCAKGAPVELIREAVRLGADINKTNKQKMPPLGIALTKGTPEAVAALLDLGAECCFPVGTKNSGEFFNAVHIAAADGKREKLDIVLQKGGARFLNQPGVDADGTFTRWLPLHAALRRGHNEFIEPLTAAGAFVNDEAGSEKASPLFVAIANNSAHAVHQLVERGANIEQRHADTGATPLIYACFHDKNFAADKLLRLGAEVNVAGKDGRTPLMLAAMQGNTRLVTALLKAGAEPNVRTAKGESALMFAIDKGNNDGIAALLKGGADPLLTDAFNRTASAYAEHKNASYYVRQNLEEAEKTALLKGFERSYRKYRP